MAAKIAKEDRDVAMHVEIQQGREYFIVRGRVVLVDKINTWSGKNEFADIQSGVWNGDVLYPTVSCQGNAPRADSTDRLYAWAFCWRGIDATWERVQTMHAAMAKYQRAIAKHTAVHGAPDTFAEYLVLCASAMGVRQFMTEAGVLMDASQARELINQTWRAYRTPAEPLAIAAD